MFWFCRSKSSNGEIIESDTSPFFPYGKYNSVSPGYNTLDELKSKLKLLDEPCKECGCLVEASSQDKNIIKRNICFDCNFWTDRFNEKDNPKAVIVNHEFYWIGPENISRDSFKGHSGRLFVIKKGEQTIKTKNLWHRGNIPDNFKDRIPNNAEFVKTKFHLDL